MLAVTEQGRLAALRQEVPGPPGPRGAARPTLLQTAEQTTKPGRWKVPSGILPGHPGCSCANLGGREPGSGSRQPGSHREPVGACQALPQTQNLFRSGGPAEGGGAMGSACRLREAWSGSEAAAPTQDDGARSSRAEPVAPGTLTGGWGCRWSRSGHKGASSSAVGGGWPCVCSRGLLVTLGRACPCQGLALSISDAGRGRAEEKQRALCAPASSRGPKVRGPPCVKAGPRAPVPSSARPSGECCVSTATDPAHVTETFCSLELVSRTFTYKHFCVAGQFRGLFRRQGDLLWPCPVTVSPGGPRCRAVRSR